MSDGDVVAQGLANSGLHGAAAPNVAVEHDILVPPAAPNLEVIHTAAVIIAGGVTTGSVIAGEPVHFGTVPAHISVAPVVPPASIPALTASQAIQNAGAVLASMPVQRIFGTPNCVGDVEMIDGAQSAASALSIRSEFNKNWLSVVINYSKDRKYDGLSSVPQTQDQTTRS
jgi:hypothetical protein